MSCGEIRFLDGGIIKNAQILDSTLSDCLLSRCTFDSGTISNLLGIDEASAGRIFDAFKTLDPDKLRAFARLLLNLLTPKELIEYLSTADDDTLKVFARLLLKLLPPKELIEYLSTADDETLTDFAKLLFSYLTGSSTVTPDSTFTSTLPTTMYGDHRKGLMGGPDTWIKVGDYLVPGYTVADGKTDDGTLGIDLHFGG